MSRKKASLPHGTFLHQEGQGLNAGVRQSTLFAIREEASSVAILLADIPMLEPRDLKEAILSRRSRREGRIGPFLEGRNQCNGARPA